ncbi:PAS-domain containing protein [Rubellimicrobium mesophilum]|nr:PAS-domain containing protein [Rubellimicrobium mesophilum]
MHLLDAIGAGIFAFSGALLIVWGLTLWTRRPPVVARRRSDPIVFLFEGQDLVDATPAARRLLRGQPEGGPDLAKVLRLLERGFGPDLGPRLAELPSGGRLSLASPNGAGAVEVAEEGGALRLTLRPDGVGASAIDTLAFDAAREELQLLRGLAEDSPHPIWTLDVRGELTWANRAYLALADIASVRPGDPDGATVARAAWPVQPLWDSPTDLAEGRPLQERLALASPDSEEPLWYDVTSVRRGPGSLHFATDVTSLVQAEVTRLHFVQTLAKTFAHLATGLAVFDRDRRLVLFNPAFLDLTGLPIEFLSGRPLVQAVLDRLRDARILPEPRDYASWRESVAALEAAAAQGEYRETWTLPGGQTWRVTGRPHPDGALAFLFEDISGEVGLARRIRTEVDTMRDVLDALDEAVAVFSPAGGLFLSSATYEGLWGPSSSAMPDKALADEVARWKAGCHPSSAWSRLENLAPDRPTPIEEQVRLLDGRKLAMRAAPLPHGALLVRFQGSVGRDRPEDEALAPHDSARRTEPA